VEGRSHLLDPPPADWPATSRADSRSLRACSLHPPRAARGDGVIVTRFLRLPAVVACRNLVQVVPISPQAVRLCARGPHNPSGKYPYGLTRPRHSE
jgi:hypothetical protein